MLYIRGRGLILTPTNESVVNVRKICDNNHMYKFSYNDTSDEVTMVYPSGRVSFIGVWDAVCTMWDLGRRRVPFTINGELIHRPNKV